MGMGVAVLSETFVFVRVACSHPTIILACPSVRLSVNILLVHTITQKILVALGPNVYHGCISGVSRISWKMIDLDIFFEVISTCKCAMFACKHDNSTHISHIGPKLIPWMYRRSVLVKFEDRWP